MRLIGTLSPDEQLDPYVFSEILRQHGIENECEEVSSPREGVYYRVWVYEEDDVEEAQNLFVQYKQNPSAFVPQKVDEVETMKEEKEIPKVAATRTRRLSPAPYGKLTLLILLACVFLFVWAQIQGGAKVSPKIGKLSEAPLLPPVDRALIYDFPKYFELVHELFTIYTPKQIENKEPPPPEALKLIDEIAQTPYWNGFYDRIVAYFRDQSSPFIYDGPMFEKIQQGEIWRFLTPVLLHFNLLHIFFNLLWFIMLGNQIEFRIGWLRYLIILLLTAIIPNTAQYLMSGSFFMGISGVIVGLAGFIWARQRVAPWEGYLFPKVTFLFLAIFVLGIFALQVIFFFVEIFGNARTPLPIANTAHITGGIVGYLLGRMRFFGIPHHRSH